ncbi:unnamed protein product [Phytophthora lilii]|uniref:Unnamed protein product n=1 Tax=Phytophthora lilii TaxID=2077276 RepID=A0A9W6THH9_9STRA|nr:unnamed protein product [Phytophthora lilii]
MISTQSNSVKPQPLHPPICISTVHHLNFPFDQPHKVSHSSALHRNTDLDHSFNVLHLGHFPQHRDCQRLHDSKLDARRSDEIEE